MIDRAPGGRGIDEGKDLSLPGRMVVLNTVTAAICWWGFQTIFALCYIPITPLACAIREKGVLMAMSP